MSLTNPLWTWPLLRALVRGFRMGCTSQPVIAYAVEDNWDKPLHTVRQELGIAHYFGIGSEHLSKPPINQLPKPPKN